MEESMAEQERTDAMKAVNNSLTPPDQDKADVDPPYPSGGGQEIRAGSGGTHRPPGYGAPPGRRIDPDADPAAANMAEEAPSINAPPDEAGDPSSLRGKPRPGGGDA